MNSSGQLPPGSATDSSPSSGFEEKERREIIEELEVILGDCAKLSGAEATWATERCLALEHRLDMIQKAQGLIGSLSQFVRQAWNIVEPETPLIWSWHYEYLCEWLELVSSGKFKELYPEKLGLIINVPPRSGKSTFGSVCWPVWTWLLAPGRRFLFASHSNPLAVSHNNKRRLLIESHFFQERFANYFSLIKTTGDMLINNHTGQFHVTSITQGSTGFGGMVLVGDDLLDREDAFSMTKKKKTNSWIDSSFSKMLDDQVRGVTVHISQRLAVDDPTGHILGEDKSTGKADHWIRIKIKREAEENEEYIFPISKHVHARPKGDILQAERCPPSVLVRLKSKPREWANQEQQEPTPAEGALLNPHHLRWYKANSPLPTFFQVVLSIDCNFAKGADNDLVAMHKYAMVYNRRYLLDRCTEQIGYIQTKVRAKEMSRGGHLVPWLPFPMPAATQVLIENKANGPALTEELRADPTFGLAVIDYDPKGSKTQRFIAATGDVAGGLVYFPEDAPWIGSLVKVLCEYAGEGSVRYDDDCDAFSQFVNWSRQMQYGLLGWMEKQAAEAAGTTKIHRCVYTDETGTDIILEWDEYKQLWVDPKNPERTYAAAPADTGQAETGEQAADGTAVSDSAPGSAEGSGGGAASS
jgi:predicted phage terminase large subunit-like protein